MRATLKSKILDEWVYLKRKGSIWLWWLMRFVNAPSQTHKTNNSGLMFVIIQGQFLFAWWLTSWYDLQIWLGLVKFKFPSMEGETNAINMAIKEMVMHEMNGFELNPKTHEICLSHLSDLSKVMLTHLQHMDCFYLFSFVLMTQDTCGCSKRLSLRC